MDGSVAAPAYSFAVGSSNTGLFRTESNELGIAAGGVERLRIGSTITVSTSVTSATDTDLTLGAASGKNVKLSGQKFPNADGTSGQILKTDGAGTLSWFTHVINSSIYLYVSPTGSDTTGDGTSGNPWATLAKAFAYLDDKFINGQISANVFLASGTYNWSASAVTQHPCGARITVGGATPLTKTMTSLTSSGSSGAWDLVITVSEVVTDVAVGDYVIIREIEEGTWRVNPYYIPGCWRVTAVNTGDHTITVRSTHRATSGPTLSAQTISITVVKTICKFTGCNGLLATNGGKIGSVSNLVIEGDGTVGMYGVQASQESVISISANVGIVKFWCNIAAFDASNIAAYYVVSSSSSARSVVAARNSSIIMGYGIVSGNTSIGVLTDYGGDVEIGAGVVSGNEIGLYPSARGVITAYNVKIVSHTNGIYCTDQGHAYVQNATIKESSSYGIFANNMALVLAYSVTMSGNGTDFSPAVNTEGNYGSYIRN